MTVKLQNHCFKKKIKNLIFLAIYQYIANKEKAGYDPGIN
jgi:hypothetical protein